VQVQSIIQIAKGKKMRTLTSLVLALLVLSTPAFAEIEKVAVPCDEGMCLFWWPKLPAVNGWHQDRDSCLTYKVNAQAPNGYSFVNAEAVIYANALYKPRIPDIASMEMLIENDKEKFLSTDPSIIITRVASQTTGDGQDLRSFAFIPGNSGNWERVSYGEEGDFFLIFTVSSKTEDGLNRALPAYEQFISHYRERP